MSIESASWPKLLEAVYEINSATCHADFAAAVVAGMLRLIPAEVSVFQVLDRAGGRIMTRMAPENPFTAEEISHYATHSADHPLVSYFARTGETRARRISDVIRADEWVRSAYYQRCLQRLHLPHALALPIRIDEAIVAGLSFSRRERDFSAEECELLDAFAPHFRQAWQRQENPWRDMADAERTARRRFEDMGLTRREGEVLYWMSEGKQNREIAEILGIRLSTVQEYVANLLAKLKQENRHAATVYAIGVLRAG